MVPTKVPDFATHYYDGRRHPFQNLSDLEGNTLDDVLRDLSRDSRSDDAYKRTYGPKYMDMRRRTESRLRQMFETRGGMTERASPHYFCLGECRWFAGLYPDTRAIRIDLKDLPPRSTSVTYPDSFVAMALSLEFGFPQEPKPYHEQVFLLDEIPAIAERWGLPDPQLDLAYDGYHRRPFEIFVEIQVWSDDPVSRYLTGEPPAA
ncbi:MAG: hypothetical protein NXI30_16925 [bacterium]|nr:hypothetical protein [bacterium]